VDADGDVTLELILDDGRGTPPTSAQATVLFENLGIYLGTGSGVFEPGLDVLVTRAASLALDGSGTQRVWRARSSSLAASAAPCRAPATLPKPVQAPLRAARQMVSCW